MLCKTHTLRASLREGMCVCLTLCSPLDCSTTGSSVCGIFLAIVQKQVAISYSGISSWPRDRTKSLVSPTLASSFFTTSTTWEAPREIQWKLLSHVWLCDPMDYMVHGILQARILEWGVFPFSRGSSQPRGQTQVSLIAGGFFAVWATREAQEKGKETWIQRERYRFCGREGSLLFTGVNPVGSMQSQSCPLVVALQCVGLARPNDISPSSIPSSFGPVPERTVLAGFEGGREVAPFLGALVLMRWPDSACRCEAVTVPAAARTFPHPPCRIFISLKKGPSRTPRPLKSEARMTVGVSVHPRELHSSYWGSPLVHIHPHLHPSSLASCFLADFSIRHEDSILQRLLNQPPQFQKVGVL